MTAVPDRLQAAIDTRHSRRFVSIELPKGASLRHWTAAAAKLGWEVMSVEEDRHGEGHMISTLRLRKS